MTDSWWVKNDRDLEWEENGNGIYALVAADEFAFTFNVLAEGQPMSLYHHEPHQEGFLVLRGECDLIVEGETHRLRPWDYFHCPPGVAHTIVGVDDALVIGVGSRVGGGKATYPNDPDPRAAYAAYGEFRKVESPL
jgi:quercetin dioxygenase-like cupin family protein